VNTRGMVPINEAWKGAYTSMWGGLGWLGRWKAGGCSAFLGHREVGNLRMQ